LTVASRLCVCYTLSSNRFRRAWINQYEDGLHQLLRGDVLSPSVMRKHRLAQRWFKQVERSLVCPWLALASFCVWLCPLAARNVEMLFVPSGVRLVQEVRQWIYTGTVAHTQLSAEQTTT
jgi:hypothetical protein